MPAAFSPTTVTVEIDGTPVDAILLSMESTLRAGEPSVARVLLHTQDPRDIDVSDYEEKEAVVKLNGTAYITGHVWSIRNTAGRKSLSCVLTIKDKRAMLSKTWVGQRHLDGNGIKVLGADIVFNKYNKPNKQVGVLDFIYNKADTGEEPDCDAIEGEYWTVKTAIEWLWQEYVDDITVPTIPSAAGFEAKLGEINLFGMPVPNAIDALFAKTRAGLYVDGASVAHVFYRGSPRSTRTLTLPPSSTVINATDYTLDQPSYFDVNRSVENTVTHVDIVGNKQQREIMVDNTEWYEAVSGVQVQPNPEATPASGGSGFAISWYNYAKQPVYRHALRKDIYENHDCGKNIRRKDEAKPIAGELLTKRDKEGQYLDPENECGLGGLSVMEMIAQHFTIGAALDADRGEIVESVEPEKFNQAGISKGHPPKTTMVIETEIRKYATATTARGTLPSSYRRVAVLRNDFVHKTREDVEIPVPVCLSWIADAGANYQEYHYNEAIDLNELGVEGIDWERTYIKDFYGTLDDDGPSFRPTVILYAGVVVDGVSPLEELANSIENELGEPNVNVEGAFPSLRSFDVGDKIESSDADWGLTGNEFVVGISFDGRTQELGFVATNHIGADALELAQRFVDTRRFRYPS